MNCLTKSFLTSSFALLFFCGYVSAEILELKSGHKISGEVVSEETENKKTYVIIKTEFGGTLKLEKDKFVKPYYGNDAIAAKYKSLTAGMADTPDAHWEVYDWCFKQDKRRFRDQMNYHVQQVLRLDPSDRKARNKLGFVESGGRWVQEDRRLAERGYERFKGKWVSKLQVSVNDKKEVVETEFNKKKTALTKWRRNTLGKKPNAQVRSELLSIMEPRLVSLIASKDYLEKAKKKKNPELRMLYLEAIDHVGGLQAQNILVVHAITDADPAVRDLASTLLVNPDKYSLANAVGPATKYLGSSKNSHVRRAAVLLEQVNSPAAILPLIGSLVTKHKVATGNDPNRSTYSQGTGGTSFSPGGGPSHREVTLSNDEVRQALRTITKSDHGFDAKTWSDWYVQEHTISNYDFRRDE